MGIHDKNADASHESINRPVTEDEMPTQLFQSDSFQEELRRAEAQALLTEISSSDLIALDDVEAPLTTPPMIEPIVAEVTPDEEPASWPAGAGFLMGFACCALMVAAWALFTA